MNNNTCIIFTVEGNQFLIYILRISDNACSPPHNYQSDRRHLSEFVCDSNIGSATAPGAPKVLSGAPTCSHTFHNPSHGTPVPVIRDISYSESQLVCPPRVLYSPEIDASKFTLHILSVTPGGFQRLEYILQMSPGVALPTPSHSVGSVSASDGFLCINTSETCLHLLNLQLEP